MCARARAAAHVAIATAHGSSAGAARSTPNDLDQAKVRGEILLALALQRPVRARRKDLAAQLVGDADAGGGAVLALPVSPVELLGARDSGPVSPGELTEGLGVAHGG